ETEKSVVAQFFERASALVKKWLRDAWDWVDEWLRKWFSRAGSRSHSASDSGWMVWSKILLYGLLLLAVLGLIALLVYILRERQREAKVVATEPIQPAPDVADESVGPERLPEDGWVRLARDLVERGELRLALRAFYLATLAHLAARNLITLAK